MQSCCRERDKLTHEPPMNPNYNPQIAADAENAIRMQTDATVKAIETGRQTQLTNPQREAAIAGSLNAVDEVRRQLKAMEPIVSIRCVVGNKAKYHSANGDREIVSFHATEDRGESSFSLDLTLAAGRVKEGDEFYLELRPSVSSSQAEFTQAGAGMGNGGVIEEAIGNPPFGSGTIQKPMNPKPEKETLTKRGDTQNDTSVDPTTGTTGPQGTNDMEQRSNRAEGGPVDPNDPDATGPSTDAGQQTKGELKDGLQTGGTSGAGTGKGERTHDSKTIQ